MKITFKDTEKFVRFDTLRHGDIFIDPDYDKDTIMMCVDTCCDTVLTTDMDVTNTEYDGFAVDIATGIIIGYGYDDKVIPVNAELVVEK